MAYNTGNPVGSRSPKDLLDNSENLDELVNSPTKETHPDRLGVDRKTWHGLEVDFQQFLADSAYQPLGDYDTDGPFTVEYRNQVFIKDGEYYRAAASTTLPYSTTDWATDESKFVGVGDAVLRQALSDPSSGAEVDGSNIKNGTLTSEAVDNSLVISMPSISAMTSLTEVASGQSVGIRGPGGSKFYKWMVGDYSSMIDGVNVIASDGNPAGDLGAFVAERPESSFVTAQQSLLDKAVSVTEAYSHYIVGRSDEQIGIGNSQSGGEGVEFQFKLDDDGMLLMRGGIAAPVQFSGVSTDAQNLVGNFVTSGTNPSGNYARNPGDTFDLDFEGAGLIFHHFADDRGGVWDVVIDGAPAIQVSTWAASNGAASTTVVTGLTEGAHTCTFTFAGDDPVNPPSSGAGNSRGWFFLPSTPGVHTGTGISESAPKIIEGTGTNRRAVISPSSIPEFAITAVPDGSGLAAEWVPQHGAGGAGACRDVVRDIIVDGVSVGDDVSAISEVSQGISTVTIVQSYTAYNANDGAGSYPMWDGVISHVYKDGVLTVDHVIKVTGAFSSVGYLNMFPTDSRYTDEFRNGTGYSKSISAVDLDTNVPFSLTAAFVNTGNGDAAVFDSQLPTGVKTGAPLVPGETFLQERISSYIGKFYLRAFNGDDVEVGERFASRGRYFLMASSDFSGIL